MLVMSFDEILAAIAKMMEERTGVVTNSDNLQILKNKIMQFCLIHTEFKTQEELVDHIASHSFNDEKLQDDLVEHLLNHETAFYRDKPAFQTFQNFLLPKLLKQNRNLDPIRIWSTACSSGQEAYSLALICAKEQAKIGDRQIKIYGSDVSEQTLQRAQSGIYSKLEVQRGLPIVELIEYFEQLNLNSWQLKEPIRTKLSFFQHNLFEPLPPDINFQFDFILCRNVLIYFRHEKRPKVLKLLRDALKPEGYVMFGSSESMFNNREFFKPTDEKTDYLIYQRADFANV